MANKKKKKASNSYWMKFGGSNSSNLPAYRRYENGGDPSKDNTQDTISDPTFKAWFAKNAKRSDVMQSSGNPEQLKSLFLSDIKFPGNEMPLFSGEVDGFGNIDKSNRDLGLSMQMIGGPEMKHGGGLYANMNARKKAGTSRSKKNSTISPEAYKNMQNGFAMYGGKKIQYGNGGEVLPMYNKGGHTYAGGGNRSDYSGVNDRNENMGTKAGQTIGDSNLLQNLDYVLPGLGSGLDFLADLWGFKGEQDQYIDNRRDGSEAAGTLDVITDPNANKGTLNLSTRTDALNSLVGFTQVKPTFGNYLAPRMIQTAASGVSKYAAGEMGKLAGGMGGGAGEVGDSVMPIEIPAGDALANYGGNMKDLPVAYKGLPKANMGGRMDSMKDMMTGPTEIESGMDLRNKTKMAFGGGGAMTLGPGMALPNMRSEAMGVRSPYGTTALMQSTGMAGEQAMAQGGQAPAQYEAEGGEVIMHEPGNQPSTTGNMESLGANEMVSKLEGSSHDNGGEVVEGEGDQYVFSNELKSEKWGNISFSDAAEKIAKNIEKYTEASKEGDDITKSTAESMIQAWTQKLSDLKQEQETARKGKFMEMVNSGADQETLMQNFPDLTEQMLAEQALQQQQPDMPMEQDNPMGNIDMSQLSPEDQQLIGAKYGLPHYNHGGSHDEFDPFNFNTYASDLTESGLFGEVEETTFDLGRNYTPNNRDLLNVLTENFNEEGVTFNDETYLNPKNLRSAILSDYETKRSAHIKDATGLDGKPKRKNYLTTTEVENEDGTTTSSTSMTDEGKLKLQQDKAAWTMYNSGLSGDWSENFGAESNMSARKYFKTFYNDLIAKGTDPELAATLTEKEKMKKAKIDAANLEVEAEKKEMTPEDKAAALIEEQQNYMKNKKILGDIGNTMLNLAPTMYNFAKGNESPEVEEFQANRNDEEVEQLLRGLTKKDISQELTTNEETFNNLKYLASDMSDGSSANAMNTLLRGQIFKQDADAAAYEAAAESNQANVMVLADYLNKAGENDRAERIRRTGINSQNKAAVEAFTAKGWEGLSGANQLRQQMEGMINRDEQLKGLLDDIYPDVQKYKTETGGIDLEALIKAHPELEEQLKNYFKAAK